MKRRDLVKKIKMAAKSAGVAFEMDEGGKHSLAIVGSIKTTIPRHTEIAEYTAEAIMKQLESELGKGWWR